MQKKSDDLRSTCPLSNTLDLLGDRWSLLIVRDILVYGKHEFKEMLASPEGIATNILTDRLRKLTACGVIGEILHPQNKSRKLYYATEKGRDLMPVLVEMLRWAQVYLPYTTVRPDLAARIAVNPAEVRAQILDSAIEWERQYVLQSGAVLD